jgi:hypothetical protein
MEEKNKVARPAAIVAIVFSSLAMFGSLILTLLVALARDLMIGVIRDVVGGYYWQIEAIYNAYLVMAIIWLLFALGFGIGSICVSAKILKGVKNGNLTRGSLVALVVLSVFTNWITLIVAAVALAQYQPMDGSELGNNQSFNGQNNIAQKTESEFEGKVKRLKQYKADGIITEKQYQEKLNELIEEQAKLV